MLRLLGTKALPAEIVGKWDIKIVALSVRDWLAYYGADALARFERVIEVRQHEDS